MLFDGGVVVQRRLTHQLLVSLLASSLLSTQLALFLFATLLGEFLRCVLEFARLALAFALFLGLIVARL